MEKLVLLFAVAAAIAQSKNPCQDVTLGNCRVEDDNIVDESNFPAEICEESCKLSDNCHYWRALQNATMELPQCLHLRTDFQQVMREGQKHTPWFRIVPVLRDPLTVTLTRV